MNLKHRNHTQIRSLGSSGLRAGEKNGRKTISLQVVKYRVVDSFGSLWQPGVFNKALESRMPQLAWGHDWKDVIGRGFEHSDEVDGPFVEFYLDDFEAVPRARQAYAQVQSGTIDDCSVGFSNLAWREPTDEERAMFPGVREVMVEAELDEVSLVLRGAVPGAKVLAVRSAGMLVPAEHAGQVIADFAAGKIDLADALQSVKSQAVEPAAVSETAPEGTPTAPDPAKEAEPIPVETPDKVEEPAKEASTEEIPVEPATNPDESGESEVVEEITQDDTDALLAEADNAIAMADRY